jgi:hypothetical protein
MNEKMDFMNIIISLQYPFGSSFFGMEDRNLTNNPRRPLIRGLIKIRNFFSSHFEFRIFYCLLFTDYRLLFSGLCFLFFPTLDHFRIHV